MDITSFDRSDRDYPEDFADGENMYQCTCSVCKLNFFGYKRRVICKICTDEINGAPLEDSTIPQKELRFYDKLMEESLQTNFVFPIEELHRRAEELRNMKILRPVSATQDGDGHWYVIPTSLTHEFSKDSQNEDFIDSGGFNTKYGKYMTGGDLNNIQLYAHI